MVLLISALFTPQAAFSILAVNVTTWADSRAVAQLSSMVMCHDFESRLGKPAGLPTFNSTLTVPAFKCASELYDC